MEISKSLTAVFVCYSENRMEKKSLRQFFGHYVDGSAEKALVPDAKLTLCNLTNVVASVLGRGEGVFAVHMTTRSLKHLYDKKPAEEFSCILDGLEEVVRFPTHIYANKEGKRGGYCLVGTFNGCAYICSIEIVPVATVITPDRCVPNVAVLEEIQVVTAFRKRDEKYLSKYTLLWSREDGNPHRSALDAPEGVY